MRTYLRIVNESYSMQSGEYCWTRISWKHTRTELSFSAMTASTGVYTQGSLHILPTIPKSEL